MDEGIRQLKQSAAMCAVEFVRPGMVVGLGHGSTALFAVRRIAELLRSGGLSEIFGVSCSLKVERVARQLGIPLTGLDKHPVIDITIDGADEVDPNLDLIKGGGGALLREKIIAQASRREIIVVDETKLSPLLGTRRPVPVEVVPFGWLDQALFVESMGARVTLRRVRDREIYKTDQGNFILDCDFGPLSQPSQVAAKLKGRTGIVEHGLFLELATDVFVAGPEGVRHLKRSNNP